MLLQLPKFPVEIPLHPLQAGGLAPSLSRAWRTLNVDLQKQRQKLSNVQA